MKEDDLRSQLNAVSALIRSEDGQDAADLVCSVWTALLKRIYGTLRGQVPPVVLRCFLDSEVEIGGEHASFNAFDSDQMMGLFGCEAVLAALPDYFPDHKDFFSATRLPALWQWMKAAADQNEKSSFSVSAFYFFHAWLQVAAESVGISGLTALSGPVEKPTGASPASAPESLPAHGKPFTEPTTGMRFVFVPGGEFSMGDTLDEGGEDEKPVHTVVISDFYMAATPVTQAQWKQVMPENPSRFSGDAHPVEQVTLADVTAFIEKLNAAAPSGIRFDLPSEAQWEYAARSGGKEELYAGGQDPDAVAWFDENTSGHTAPVAQKTPNGLGLFDMSGNVWEWCRDVYAQDAYRRHAVVDPVCATGDGNDQVIRGGAWHLDAWSARCARRFRFDPDLFGPALGFRLVMIISG